MQRISPSTHINTDVKEGTKTNHFSITKSAAEYIKWQKLIITNNSFNGQITKVIGKIPSGQVNFIGELTPKALINLQNLEAKVLFPDK